MLTTGIQILLQIMGEVLGSMHMNNVIVIASYDQEGADRSTELKSILKVSCWMCPLITCVGLCECVIIKPASATIFKLLPWPNFGLKMYVSHEFNTEICNGSCGEK